MHRETSGENQKEETMKVRGDIMIKIKNNKKGNILLIVFFEELHNFYRF